MDFTLKELLDNFSPNNIECSHEYEVLNSIGIKFENNKKNLSIKVINYKYILTKKIE